MHVTDSNQTSRRVQSVSTAGASFDHFIGALLDGQGHDRSEGAAFRFSRQSHLGRMSVSGWCRWATAPDNTGCSVRLLFSFTPSDSVRKERRHAVLRSAEGRLDNGDFIGAALRALVFKPVLQW